MKFTLRKIIKIGDALAAIENVTGFQIKTSFKLSGLKNDVEKHIRDFHSEREKNFLAKKLDSVDGMKETDYVYVGIKNAYNVPIGLPEFQQIDEQLQELLDGEEHQVELPDRKFSLSDFQSEVTELALDGKKRERKQVTLVTPSFLAAMCDFIKDVEETETVET